MRNPETVITNRILDRLEAEGGWWFKVHGSIFQKSGIPDIIGCYQGHFIAIEVKTGTGVASKLQKIILKQINKAGGKTGIARSVEDALLIRDVDIYPH